MSSEFQPEERLEYLKQFGSHCMAYSTLQPGMEYFDRPGIGYLAYMTQAGTRFILAEPICDPSERETLIAEALREHEDTCFVQVQRPTAELLCSRFGYRATQMGIETSLELDDWNLDGKAKFFLRRARNDAKKIGITVAEGASDASSHQAVEALSEKWLQTRKANKRQMAFLARPLTNLHEPLLRRFFARQNQEIVGFVFFEPFFHNGQVLGYAPGISRSSHLARGLFYPLVLEAMDQFRKEKIQCLNVGLSPLSPRAVNPVCDAPLFALLLQMVRAVGNSFYNFKGVEFSKARFHGNERPVYFVHRGSFPLRQTFSLFRLCHVI